MKIALVSYLWSLPAQSKIKKSIEIINQSSADLILFSGHTLNNGRDIEKLRSGITNEHVEAFIEVKDIKSRKVNNCLYQVKRGRVKSLYTNQLFSESKEIEANPELGDRLLFELESRRSYEVCNRKILLLQCGELNILKNLQSDDNKVVFRLSDYKGLLKRFKQLLVHHDIILNPIHTPMGNQGKMSRRREYLSSSKRSYFSTSNSPENSQNMVLTSLQYALNGRRKIHAREEVIESDCAIRVFEID